MSMNKRDLAKVYKKRHSSNNLTVKKAVEEINEFLETVKEAIAIDSEVRFPKRGAFEILIRQPRVVSNPVTREQMEIYPKKTVRFRASKKMKQFIENFTFYRIKRNEEKMVRIERIHANRKVKQQYTKCCFFLLKN